MKSFSTTLLPALALLTLGGCAGTSGLTSTEPDGVYYSSKDQTTEVVTASVGSNPAADVAAADDQGSVANPEYQDDSKYGNGNASDEYYDDDYSYSARIRRFHQPYYRGLGMGYYDLAYVDPYWYNPGAAFYGYDVYGYPYYGGYAYAPYYGGVYSPYWGYGGPFVSISIGYGWGSPWGYRPYGYRYGGRYGGYYDNYYGGGYYGSGYAWGGYRNGNRNVHYGPRRDRSSDAVTSGGRTNGGRPVIDNTGGRMASGGNDNLASPATTTRRPRIVEEAGSNRGQAIENNGGGVTNGTGWGRITRADDAPSLETQPSTGRGKLYRIVDTETAPENQTGGVRTGASQNNRGEALEMPTRRQRLTENTAQPELAGESGAVQPQRQRRERAVEYGQPQQQAQPAQQYERPVRRERTYESAPSRSYEAPASRGSNYGGGNSGGGNSGGGSSSGGRGRVRE
ncbi:hypothetical protein [Hymenobacter busanensis]|uniref:hypothetical protein n=1 Tax=Hymenobacter busanensis TaxID=2607656 RepID=UPI0013674477|nr:hypothetical protein [Hymenobacter busanensis]QHJ08490.1 hypothetical protein GUY19_14825 [Hymenobacter busanensis]